MMNEVSRRGLFALLGGAGVAAAASTVIAAAKAPKPPVRIVDATILWWNGRQGHARADDGARYTVGRAYVVGRQDLKEGDRVRLRVYSYTARSVSQAEVLT